MSSLFIVFAALSALLFLFCVYLFADLNSARKEAEIPIRGMLKYYALTLAEGSLKTKIRRWSYALLALSVTLSVAVAVQVYKTDHSFFVFLFPILWYYFVIRFFLWEKSDLVDKPKTAKQKR